MFLLVRVAADCSRGPASDRFAPREPVQLDKSDFYDVTARYGRTNSKREQNTLSSVNDASTERWVEANPAG